MRLIAFSFYNAHAVQCCKMNERFSSDPVLDPMEREAFHDSFRNKQFVERLESFLKEEL
jgi:hypothetical protein